MVVLKELPPTIWWMWGVPRTPGLTRLCGGQSSIVLEARENVSYGSMRSLTSWEHDILRDAGRYSLRAVASPTMARKSTYLILICPLGKSVRSFGLGILELSGPVVRYGSSAQNTYIFVVKIRRTPRKVATVIVPSASPITTNKSGRVLINLSMMLVLVVEGFSQYCLSLHYNHTIEQVLICRCFAIMTIGIQS